MSIKTLFINVHKVHCPWVPAMLFILESCEVECCSSESCEVQCCKNARTSTLCNCQAMSATCTSMISSDTYSRKTGKKVLPFFINYNWQINSNL